MRQQPTASRSDAISDSTKRRDCRGAFRVVTPGELSSRLCGHVTRILHFRSLRLISHAYLLSSPCTYQSRSSATDRNYRHTTRLRHRGRQNHRHCDMVNS